MAIEMVEHYYQMIQHLDNADKMILVEKIIHSVNSQQQSANSQKTNNLADLFGSWEDNRSADEIIADIKASSHLQRQIESFE